MHIQTRRQLEHLLTMLAEEGEEKRRSLMFAEF